MSFRIEEKVPCTRFELFQITSHLQIEGMMPLHPGRMIRSLYFDNRILGMFEDSEEGVLPRRKIRARDYPSEKFGLNLETKTSSVEGRFKTTRRLEESEAEKYKRTGILDAQYGICFPKVWVSYYRAYYLLDGIRITFDTQINYRDFNSSKAHAEDSCVVELKAPFGTTQDSLGRLLAAPRRRFSKYSNAIRYCLAVQA